MDFECSQPISNQNILTEKSNDQMNSEDVSLMEYLKGFDKTSEQNSEITMVRIWIFKLFVLIYPFKF
jgi:hypothetical protein